MHWSIIFHFSAIKWLWLIKRLVHWTCSNKASFDFQILKINSEMPFDFFYGLVQMDLDPLFIDLSLGLTQYYQILIFDANRIRLKYNIMRSDLGIKKELYLTYKVMKSKLDAK